MRYTLVSILTLTASLTWAAPKSSGDFFSQSSKLLKELQEKSPKAAKLKSLHELKASLEDSRKQYKKLHPKEGTAAEDAVNRLYYALEPVFDLSKKTSWDDKDCLKTESQVTEDSEKLTPEQVEALKWLKIFCD